MALPVCDVVKLVEPAGRSRRTSSPSQLCVGANLTDPLGVDVASDAGELRLHAGKRRLVAGLAEGAENLDPILADACDRLNGHLFIFQGIWSIQASGQRTPQWTLVWTLVGKLLPHAALPLMRFYRRMDGRGLLTEIRRLHRQDCSVDGIGQVIYDAFPFHRRRPGEIAACDLAEITVNSVPDILIRAVASGTHQHELVVIVARNVT